MGTLNLGILIFISFAVSLEAAETTGTELQHLITVGRKEFYYSPKNSEGASLTWLGALHYCKKQGMNLAEFASDKKLEAVAFALKQNRDTKRMRGFWTGGNIMDKFRQKTVHASEYKWISTGRTIPSTMWRQSSTREPNRLRREDENGQYDYESCVDLRTEQGTLNDYSCFGLNPCLCQKKISKV